MKTLEFDLLALASSPRLASLFNSEAEKSFDDPSSLFYAGSEKEGLKTYNGVLVHTDAEPNLPETGLWDASVAIDSARGRIVVVGSDGCSGGSGTFRVEFTPLGNSVDLGGYPLPEPYKTMWIRAVYVEPASEEAYRAIKEAFGYAVYDSVTY